MSETTQSRPSSKSSSSNENPNGNGNGNGTQDSAALAGGRMTAAQIFQVVARTGEDELKRSTAGLGISGLAAGLSMGLSGLGSASILNLIGSNHPASHLLASLLYPLGFIVVIVGRAQLFTENTLFPVVLVLERRRHLRNTLRLWAVVFVANVLGAALFAVLAVKTPALTPSLRATLAELGEKTTQGDFGHIFWAGVIGGWIIALMAWLVSAARFTMGQVILVYVMTFVVGAASLAHCIAGSGEALAAVMMGQIPFGSYLMWLLAATLGNTLGGVLMVSLLNYGQVFGSGRDPAKAERSLAEVEGDASQHRQENRSRKKRG